MRDGQHDTTPRVLLAGDASGRETKGEMAGDIFRALGRAGCIVSLRDTAADDAAVRRASMPDLRDRE